MSTLYAFKDLRGQILQQLDEAGAATTDSTYLLAQNFLNQAQAARLSTDPWPFMLWDTPETFTLAPPSRFYTLHQEFWRPEYFFNRSLTQFMIETTMRSIPGSGVRWNTDTASPLRFRLGPRICVAAQPSASSTLTIASTSSADSTAARSITVRGMTANGVTSETLQPAGMTPVVSVNAYTKILAVTKGAAWTGNLTMTSNSGAVTNLFLFPPELARSYQVFETLVMPSSADVVEYRFFRQPTIMVADDDVPDIPPPHSQILVWDACLLFAGYITDLNPASTALWSKMQGSMEVAMKQAFLQGQSAEAEPRYIRYIEGGDGTSPFVRST